MKLFNLGKKQEDAENKTVHNEVENELDNKAENEVESNEDNNEDNQEERLKRIALQPVISKAQLMDLSIAETIHVVKYLEVFHKASPLAEYEEKHALVYKTVLEKIKEAPTLYVLFDETTQLPFVATGFAELYSKKEFAQQAVEHYATGFRTLSVREVDKEDTEWLEGVNLFAYFYYLGIEDLLIDNGQQKLQFKRVEILEAPDWSEMEEADRPIINGELRFWMNIYLGEARWAVDYEGHGERVHQLEEEMVKRLKEGRFLVPVVTDKETGEPTRVATLPNSNKQLYLPMFTDWFEFDRVYDSEAWNGMAITFHEAVQYARQCAGFVINPKAENFMAEKEIIEKRFPEFISVE